MTFLGFPLESAASAAQSLLVFGGIALASLTGLVTYLNNRVKTADALATSEAIAIADATAKVAVAEAGAANERTKLLELKVGEQQERAAKAEADLLLLEERIKPRRLSALQRREVVAHLSASPHKGQITITALLGDIEGNTLAAQFDEILLAAGWTTNGVDRVVVNGRAPEGVGMAIQNAAAVPPFAVSLQQAFEAVGVEILGAEKPLLPPGVVELIVGIKPLTAASKGDSGISPEIKKPK